MRLATRVQRQKISIQSDGSSALQEQFTSRKRFALVVVIISETPAAVWILPVR
jgi:hypothetical protein